MYTLDGPLRHIVPIIDHFNDWLLRTSSGRLTRFALQLFETLTHAHSVKLRLDTKEISPRAVYTFDPYAYAYFDIDLTNFADLMKHVISTFHGQLHHIRVLNIGFPRHFKVPAFVGALWQFMSALPNLEHVTAGGYSYLSLLELFEAENAAVVFQSLQTLVIDGAIIAHWDSSLSESGSLSPLHRVALLSHRFGGRNCRPGIVLVNCESNIDLTASFTGNPWFKCVGTTGNNARDWDWEMRHVTVYIKAWARLLAFPTPCVLILPSSYLLYHITSISDSRLNWIPFYQTIHS